MKDKMKDKKKLARPARAKWLTVAYAVLRLTVVAVGIRQAFVGDYYNVFLCFLTLLLFLIPSFVERRLRIKVPEGLEFVILLFIFAAEILGEIREYYIYVPGWDTMLHTINGFICAAVGVALIDILNRSDRFALKLSPFFVAFFAFCFSMTVGVVWEFFEYGMDTIFRTDMQKDTVVGVISSVLLNPDGRNRAVTEVIESVAVNGREWNYGGYIDIGLIDTMRDLLVNFAGAVVFSVIGYFYVKNRGKGRFASSMMLHRIPDAPDGPDGTETPPNAQEGEKPRQADA